jgi:Fe-S-cluster-containing dehydrogenase component
MKTMLIDPSRCIQCCNCQNACKDEHCDNDWRPVAAPQGPGQFWIQVRERQAADGSRMRLERVPVPCQQCAQPACKAAAPDAVSQRADGLVLLDPKGATDRALIESCPYGAIYWNAELDIAQKCTGCAHLLDAGWERPRCVTACPTDALSYVDEDELVASKLYAPLERLSPEHGTAPRVAYVRLPRPFVAGAVYSPNEDRCLEGVKVVLTYVGTADGAVYRASTDFLGEFRVGGIEPGFYTLYLEKDGYASKRIAKLDASDALNVGEIRLYPVQ